MADVRPSDGVGSVENLSQEQLLAKNRPTHRDAKTHQEQQVKLSNNSSYLDQLSIPDVLMFLLD